LIAGGILKERDVIFVKELLAKNCMFVYCIGQASQKLVDSWSEVVPCMDCGDLETAVRMACRNAKAGKMFYCHPVVRASISLQVMHSAVKNLSSGCRYAPTKR
jgi:UDP-N-acetylmuramoylalanine-D-glutamate ligase